MHRRMRARQCRCAVLRHEEPARPRSHHRAQPSEQQGRREELGRPDHVQARSAHGQQRGRKQQTGQDPGRCPQTVPVDALQRRTARTLPPPFAQVTLVAYGRLPDGTACPGCRILRDVIGHVSAAATAPQRCGLPHLQPAGHVQQCRSRSPRRRPYKSMGMLRAIAQGSTRMKRPDAQPKVHPGCANSVPMAGQTAQASQESRALRGLSPLDEL